MGPFEKLAWLTENAHIVSLKCNDQRACYRSVAEELDLPLDIYSDMDPVVRAECIERNVMHTLHVYERTPVGFLFFAHYDLEKLIDEAYAAAKGQNQ